MGTEGTITDEGLVLFGNSPHTERVVQVSDERSTPLVVSG
jgi:hypothetical protein